ncbi:MAG: hypothetical protein GC165_19200 [Armatimonadetes bacterium]|nr:hypothetical protein [Armatimonadota bacterium]
MRPAICLLVVLVVIYAYLIPKPPKFDFQFLQNCERTEYGVHYGGDAGPPAVELALYRSNQGVDVLIARMKNELRGWHSYISQSEPRSCSFNLSGVDIILLNDSKAGDTDLRPHILIYRDIEVTYYRRIQLKLFQFHDSER